MSRIMGQPHEALLLNGKPIPWRDDKERPKGNELVKWSKTTTGGKTIQGSFRTIAALNRLNNLSLRRFKTEISILQGPYNTTVAASAGTHDFDACVDWWINGVDPWAQQRFGRAAGLGNWFRHPPSFGNHQHGFVLPVANGGSVSDDFKAGGFKVGVYVDGGVSTRGGLVTSSQIADYYAHAFGLSSQHTAGSDKSWFPKDISKTVFSLKDYIQRRKDWLDKNAA